jgi:hypothetical protein
MTTLTEPRHILALEQAMTRQRDTLVRRANQTVLILSGARGKLKENQLRNVLNVAGEIDSIEGLLNFIRYQIARNWQEKGNNTRDFGHQVIEDIRTVVRQAAEQAAEEAGKRLGGQVDEQVLFENAYLRLAEEYLGYLNRAFTYCEKMPGGYKDLSDYVSKSMQEGQHAAS